MRRGANISSPEAWLLLSGCFKLSPWAAFQRWLRAKPHQVCNVLHPHIASGLLPALATGRPSILALPFVPCRYISEATHIGFLPTKGREGRLVMTQASPAPCIPAPAVFQLVLQLCQELPCFTAAASRDSVQNPKRTNTALC